VFDITSDDINQLNDIDLRELVGRLCEAELTSRGLSPAAVTWGGNQTAADGGLDVRVALPPDVSIEGFVPRRSTGFQVKKPDMPRTAITAEMRPEGTIRPIFQVLADEAGAYIIVSSTGSTADRALRDRRDALREALDGVTNADQLHTDFYDRTRLATWVRCHPGLITWVKEKVGRALVGWRPYGPWSGAAEGVDAEYLLDDKMRLHLGMHRDAPSRSVAHAIDELRDELDQPRKIVRLVGLSGVGKTRLVQALFDARIGSRPLPPSLAVYTNLSDNPDPQPIGLASDLIANQRRAVLIVDNCPPDLHGRLSELCRGQNSMVSVLTVEYDVRDDQAEGTQVVTLDTSSPELIEKLVQRRYPHLSQVDARTVAEASGGNARIAIALADTVERSDTIAGLSNDELFQRLFRQRQDPNDSLLLAAQACSLVYSFQGEALTGEEAELPRLAFLAGQSAAEAYRHVGELLRRNLVQRRGVWRAVLPHAIANRLAVRALEEIPYELINQQLVEGGTERLARSFSRRLSFLHDHHGAVAIVQRWLAPDGLLGDTTTLNHLGQAMFENVAPVLPPVTLAALERADNHHSGKAAMVWQQYQSLLRSLAYDAPLFARSAHLLARTATQNTEEQSAKEALDTFVSLFTIYLSGTHASIEQRLNVIDGLLRSGEARARTLGLAALDQVLKTTHFTSRYRFEFGARSRDYGYQPRSVADVTRWYGAALTLIEHLALAEGMMKPELRDAVGRNFRGLWTRAHMYDELENLSRRFAEDGFWREGWAACRQTMQFDRNCQTPEAASRLSALEAYLRPSNLHEQVKAVVLGDRSGGLGPEDMNVENDVSSAFERLQATARELGAAVATNDEVYAELLPDLLRGGNQVWAFGRGLASASTDLHATWARLVEGLERIAPEQRNVQVFMGFLAELWERDRDLAQHLLDLAVDQPALAVFLPVLQTAVELDEYGITRLKHALRAGNVPVRMYQALAFGRTTDHLAGEVLKDLLLLITSQSEGFDVAVEILSMRLYSDRDAQRRHEPQLLEAGRELLRRVVFRRSNQNSDYELAHIAKSCLIGPNGGPIAAEVAGRLRQAVAAYETYSFYNDNLLRALLELQPAAVLDALFAGNGNDQQVGVRMFDYSGDNERNPADSISCEALVTWCDRDGERRYPLAASIITFARSSDENQPQVWSEQAEALLAHAPNPRTVLAELIKRFRPMNWSGSRAALIEANARLLDNLEPHVQSDVIAFVTEAKAQLAQEVAQQRQWETEEDQARDERFEW
jgi:hypothetical protein